MENLTECPKSRLVKYRQNQAKFYACCENVVTGILRTCLNSGCITMSFVCFNAK